MGMLVKQGDNRPYVTELLFDGRQRYVDPTGLTVKFNMAKGGSNIVDHGTAYLVSVTIDSTRAAELAALGYLLADGSPFIAGTYTAVEYRWEDVGSTDTASAAAGGDMNYEWETTDGLGGILTFPNGSNNLGTVQAQVR